jgi:membrane-associated phospholipid phosphatase
MSPEAPPAPELVETPVGAGLGRHLIIAAAASAVLALVVYIVAVHTALGQRFDNAALLGAHGQRNSTRLGDVSLLRRITLDSLIAVLVIIAGIGIVRRRPRLGIAVAVAAAVAVGATHVLRTVILDRPELVRSDAFYPSNTFPSGHTATAFACALALVVVSAPAWRGVSAVVAGAYAWITATAVLTAGWHRPSDAIGAALLGFAVVAGTAAVIAAFRPIGSGRRVTHIPAFAVLGVVWLVASVLSILNAARVLHFLVDHADSLTPTPSVLNDAYLCSVNLTVVVVVSLLALLLYLLGPCDLDQPRSQTAEVDDKGA